MTRVTFEDIERTAEAAGLKLHPKDVIKPGDLYLAGRNSGVHLYECKLVNFIEGYVLPEGDTSYVYDIHECVKVTE